MRETKGGKRDNLAKTGMAATATGLGRGEGGGGVGQKWIQTALESIGGARGKAHVDQDNRAEEGGIHKEQT